MRPAQKAPENLAHECVDEVFDPRFNEAGAKSAGKRGPDQNLRDTLPASMRPAQKAPENAGRIKIYEIRFQLQ